MVHDLDLILGRGLKPDTNSVKEIPLGVYTIIETTNEKREVLYELKPYDKLVKGRMKTSPEVFGDILEFLKIVWNFYVASEKSEGTFFYGNSGMGKTDASNILANIALNNKLPVVIIESLSPNTEIIKFIDGLGDCVIIFEEFSKIFPYYMQQKMLSMFSATGVKRLYIINDNDKNGTSPYLLNRPGRITFKREFGKVELDVFDFYITKHGVEKDSNFYIDMHKMYKTTSVLSMDHIKYIIKFHHDYPTKDLKFILSILNVDVLNKPVTYKIMEVKKISDGSLYQIVRSPEIEKSQFDNGREYYLSLEKIVPVEEASSETAKVPTSNGMMMGNRGGFDPTARLNAFKLSNTRMIDSTKTFAKFEVVHNDEKYQIMMAIEDDN